MTRRVAAPLLVLALALGCATEQGGTTEGAATTSGTSDASSTGESTTTGGTTGGTTLDPTSGGGTLGASTGDSTGDVPLSVCDPQPADVFAAFTVDGDASPAPDPVALTHHCTVADIDQGLFLSIALAGCKLDPDDPLEMPVSHTLDAEVAPADALDLAIGEAVVFTYVVDGPWWSNRAVTIRRPSDELVVAGFIGSELPGETFGPPLDVFAPLQIGILHVCETEPFPGFCHLVRREALRLEWSGHATLEVIDRSAATWPDQPYQVVVSEARAREEVTCSDQSQRWVRMMLIRVGA